jgi:hypothetical protein
MADTPGKPARTRAASPRTKRTRRPKVSHAEIAERAYFIYLNEGCSDELDNWLRAERELTAA